MRQDLVIYYKSNLRVSHCAGLGGELIHCLQSFHFHKYYFTCVLKTHDVKMQMTVMIIPFKIKVCVK